MVIMAYDDGSSKVTIFRPVTGQYSGPAVSGHQQLNPLFNEDTAATFLNCSVAFLRRCRLHRSGPAYVKVGRLARYRPEDLQAYISARTERLET